MNATWLLLRDEFVGFAKSRVMIVLWIVLPLLALLGYFLIPAPVGDNASKLKIPVTQIMGLLLSSLAGNLAAILVAVDIITEKNNHVYDLFIIRPISKDAIVWAKFMAVFLSVTVACVVSLSLGLAIDLLRGTPLPPDLAVQTLKSLGSVTGVIAISAAIGVFFGVISDSVLVAVILLLFVGQNLTIVPMLPTFLRLGPSWYWIIVGISAATAIALMVFSSILFRRAER